MSLGEKYAERLDLASEIIETQTHLLEYLLEYTAEHRIPPPTGSDRFKALQDQANRVIQDIGLEQRLTTETELLQSIREDCNREDLRERVNQFLRGLPPELATRFRHLLYWTVYTSVQ